MVSSRYCCLSTMSCIFSGFLVSGQVSEQKVAGTLDKVKMPKKR